MKWILFFLFPIIIQAQQKEEYCEVMFIPAGIGSTKMNMIISAGNNDSRIVKEDYYAVVQGLNYIAQEGWTLVLSYPVASGKEVFPRFVFKRVFDQVKARKDSVENIKIQSDRPKQINIIQNQR